MRFKVDENLPIEIAELLRTAQHDVKTVPEQMLMGEKDLALEFWAPLLTIVEGQITFLAQALKYWVLPISARHSVLDWRKVVY